MKAFAVIDIFNFKDHLLKELKNDIESKDKQYIINVDENQFIEFLIAKYKLEQLNIEFDLEVVETPVVKKEYIDNIYYVGKKIYQMYIILRVNILLLVHLYYFK